MHEPTLLTTHPATRGGTVDALPPAQPTSVEATGLDFGLLLDLSIKTIYYHGTPTAGEICGRMALPFVVVDELLRFLRRQAFVDVVGSSGLGDQEHRYSLNSKGLAKAREVLDISQYVGPAPVPLSRYVETVHRQTIRQIEITPADVDAALGRLVLDDQTIAQIGTAVGSGKSIFLYGDSGNGKSTIAAAIGDLLPGTILVPHAVEAYGQIIRVFDPRIHNEVAEAPGAQGLRGTRVDRRWLLCHRPIVMTGGGLRLEDLELRFSPQTNYYVAPIQMKAMNGVLLVDDFGRQLVPPGALLNRWIIPIEEGVDHLSLNQGPVVELPFDLMLVFATNLTPSGLGDEGFFRRIRHKIRIQDPDEDGFRAILRDAAAKAGIAYNEAGCDYLIDKYYRGQRPFRGVHPRDILDLMNDIGKFRNEQPEFTPEWIDLACKSFFVAD